MARVPLAAGREGTSPDGARPWGEGPVPALSYHAYVRTSDGTVGRDEEEEEEVTAMAILELRATDGVEVRLDHDRVEAARLVRAARDRLLADAGAVTVPMLAEGRRSTTNAARQWIHRHRRAGRLVTVEDDRGTVLVPTFQLDDAFDLDPVVADTVAVLTAAGMSPWAVWRWFDSVNPWLDARPVDVAADGRRDQLLVAARRVADAD